MNWVMKNHSAIDGNILMYQLKPLVQTIRSLSAGGFIVSVGMPPARAELPVPVKVDALTHVPVDIATTGQATAAIKDKVLNIKQLTDKATLDWKSFNIDVDKGVRFDQPSTTSIALNRIHDSSPSKIMGSLTANGQVYLVNQNGFVFGKNSQVNANSLVATTLGISEEVFQRGITKVFDINNSAALEGNGQIYLKDEQGQIIHDQNGQKVKIQILLEKGANIKTQGEGGRVIIAAPVVNNEGSIETPDGQTIIAAAQDKVYLQEAGSDSDVRGLVVEVGAGGEVNNVGKVLAERGNVSLLGFAVNQKGIASATTSVRLNGSVHLMAREGIQSPAVTGGKLKGKSTLRATDSGDGLGSKATLTLASGSDTRVDLDTDKSATAIDAQPQLKSSIELSGHDVILREQSKVVAKSGKVSINALDNPADPKFKGNARIYMESGSKIDVSGVKNVELAMERNVVEVELRKNELRDSPLQRDGVLFGQTVAVDLRKVDLEHDTETGELTKASIPVADIKGAVDRIARNIDERSTSGGSVELNASGNVITKAGSEVDFSGGSVRYADGYIKTTQLKSGNQTFEISDADPNRHYDAIVKNNQVASNQVKGYVEGKAGGKLSINTYAAALDGSIKGKTIDGLYQRTPEQRAAGSHLSIDLSNNNLFGKQDVVISQNPTKTNITESDPFPAKSSEDKSPVALKLKAGLFKEAGIRDVSIKTNGALRIEKGAQITLPDSANLLLSAVGVDILGSIKSPSGHVTVKPIELGSAGLIPSAITLGSEANIDVSGLWVNDYLSARNATPLGLVSIDGGQVNLISEQGDLNLQKGSRIQANAGAQLQTDGTLKDGNGGSIALRAETHLGGGKVSSLLLDGQLSGWALQHGGSLQLSSNQIIVGNSVGTLDNTATAETPLLLNAGFFQQGGFGDYTLTANYHGLTVTDNTQLRPLQQNWQLKSKAYAQASGSSLKDMTSVVRNPEYIRTPTNLNLTVAQLDSQKRDATLVIGQGASIKTDMQATLALNSDTSIKINGSLETPAGNLLMTLTTPRQGDSGFFTSQGIWLGPDSRLLARGAYKAELNPFGLTMGDVLSGGTIALTANRGYIVTYGTSLLDVSGTNQNIDFRELAERGTQVSVVNRNIASTGGTIDLMAAEGILADGKMLASGGKGAAGGQVSIELNAGARNKPEVPIAGGGFPDDQLVTKPRSIEIAANQTENVTASLWQTGIVDTTRFNGRALLSNQQINASAADDLAFKVDSVAGNQFVGSILFDGNVTLSAAKQIVLDAPSLKTNNGQVTLNTAYAALGSAQSRLDTQLGQGLFTTRLAPDAVGGTGQLSVNAKGIDLIGGLSFNGFGTAELASQGDIRLIGSRVRRDTKDYLGELKLVGNLNLKASQIYPATLSQYTLNVSGSNSTVNIQPSGQTASPVLSAGGQLTINAANIIQAGTLKAPFGSLVLNATKNLELASGSLTSVSGNGWTVPFGQVAGGVNWLYPLDSSGAINQLINTPPEKRLSLTGQNVALKEGATVDLSGGGDLQAYEFIPGPGGSVDVLNPDTAGVSNQYAVIPGLNNALTPYDPLEFSNSGLSVGKSVYLSAGSGLAAGWYTLLPAHYALLPNAYLVTPVAGSKDFTPGQTTTDLTGARIVAGRYGIANTLIADARWQGFAVESGQVAKTRSEYKIYSANQFFTDKANSVGSVIPQRPKDAGSLAITVNNSLNLGSRLLASASADGLGGQVDISANRLAIVGRQEDVASTPAGTVALFADDLNNFNAPSLLLGGTRSKEAQGTRVNVQAQTVSVAGNAKITGQELILAAKDEVKLNSGATLESTGKTGKAGDDLYIANQTAANASTNSDGALLRVSSAGQSDVIRDKTITGNSGTLTVQDGVLLKAQGSMVLDSSKNTIFDGDIDMQGGALALKSSRISLGSAPTNTPGLVLANTEFDLAELELISATDLDIYGNINLTADNLAIGAANINGFANSAGPTTINADKVSLFNTASTSNRAGNGTGQLIVNAKQIELGAGEYALSGYQSVELNASQALVGKGQQIDASTSNSMFTSAGHLKVNANLTANAGRFIGENGATTQIDASGHSIHLSSDIAVEPFSQGGLGARWGVVGDSITSSAWFDLPSGIIELTAHNGDLNLLNGAVLDVSGQAVGLGDQTRYASAGRVLLTSDKRSVNLADGANISLAGAVNHDKQVGDAGLLSVNAAQGQFNWNGTVTANTANQANPSFQQGSLRLDTKTADSLSTLNNKLRAAGLSEEISIRQRTGDATLTAQDQIKAHQFHLIVDQGKATLAGNIDASASQAGSIDIYARNGIEVAATGELNASSTGKGSEGGKVTLDTVHRDDTGSGLLNLAALGGKIDVTGGVNGSGGSLHLRTGRGNSGDGVNISSINTTIKGTDPLHATVEATKVYDGQQNISSSLIDSWKVATDNYMNHVGPLQNFSGSNINLLPGLEVRSNGKLTLANQWDFVDWRYGTMGNKTLPGFLTLRAGNNLNINATLSDAFKTDSIPNQTSRKYQDMLQAGQSWSYQLIAGNDINLAHSYLAKNPLAPTSNNLVKTQVMVRTGTGDIAMQAGGDLVFSKDASNSSSAAAIYTMGTTAPYTRSQLLKGEIPGLPARLQSETDSQYLNRMNAAQMNDLLRFGFLDETRIGSLFQKAEFPTQGGDISLHAAGNIEGVETGQKISDWLVRSGTLAEGNRPTLWGINISGDRSSQTGDIPTAKGIRFFNQNVGALAGGQVNIEAGGNIQQLSVMMPTTGKPLGTISETTNQWLTNDPAINGGGDMKILAGNDIIGGEYFTGRGTADINAGGSIKSGTSHKGTLFQLGDAQYEVQARRDIAIQGVYNPTLLKQSQLVGGESRFFTYSPDSAINFQAVAGNIEFQNNAGTGFEYAVYPGTVLANSLSGDISINQSMSLFPSSQGQLELLAGRNIRSAAVAGQTVSVNMSDADVSLLPNALQPAVSLEGSLKDGLIRAQERLDAFSPVANIIHAATPVHINNANKPLIVADQGDIGFANGSQVVFYLPKAAEFSAGRDIKNLSVVNQNLSNQDSTLISAGRDVISATQLNSDGAVLANSNRFETGGAGELQVIAGRDINLGSSIGIQTLGNLLNPALGQQDGASISILAGLADKIDYAGFINQYQTNPAYTDILKPLVGKTEAEQRDKLNVLLGVFFTELKSSAAAAAAVPESQRSRYYQRGKDAIQALFPGENYAGDISLVFSQVKTLDGGSINMSAPGGKIDVGLAGQLAGIRKGSDQLGIVVQQGGDLNAFTQGDFNVNQSRVFTLGGGNITVWSSKGSIDAGKGAKSAIAAPPPITQIDEKGNIVTVFPPIVSGSGIQAIGNGQVTLAAPEGIIDAGEAGISGGQIVIAATAVVGASNIQSSGGTVGVPTAPAAPTVPAGASSAAASAAKSASDNSENNENKNADNKADSREVVSMLSTDVVGYGDCSVNDVKDGKPGCGEVPANNPVN